MIVFSEEIDRIIIAAFILLFFLILRKILRKAMFFILDKLVHKTATTIDDEIILVLRAPLELFIIALGFKFSIEYLNLPSKIDIFSGHILSSVFTFIIFLALFKMAVPLSNIFIVSSKKLKVKSLGKDLVNLITKSIQVIIVAIGFVTILQGWGYNITGFLASLGLIGMAIALAAKDTVANLFGSLVIFSDKPFKIGDWIKTPVVEGTVEAVGIRSTKVRTFAQALVSVPNAVLANSEILNWSRMGKRRIKLTLGLTYSTKAQDLQNIIKETKEMLKKHQDIHQDTIYIYFTNFDQSSLGVFCYFFTKTTSWGEFMRVKEDVNFKIMQIVENNNTSFAFPSQSIYIENTKEELL